MVFQMILFLWRFLRDVLAVSRLSKDEKDPELLLLRLQLRIVERIQERGPHIPRWQKVPLAMLAVRLKERARNGKAAVLAIPHVRSKSGEENLSIGVQKSTHAGRNARHVIGWPGLRPGFVLKGRDDVPHQTCILDPCVSHPETAGTVYPALGQADNPVAGVRYRR
jgi:hypothetical protein